MSRRANAPCAGSRLQRVLEAGAAVAAVVRKDADFYQPDNVLRTAFRENEGTAAVNFDDPANGWTVVSALGDGNCFVHALLGAAGARRPVEGRSFSVPPDTANNFRSNYAAWLDEQLRLFRKHAGGEPPLGAELPEMDMGLAGRTEVGGASNNPFQSGSERDAAILGLTSPTDPNAYLNGDYGSEFFVLNKERGHTWAVGLPPGPMKVAIFGRGLGGDYFLATVLCPPRFEHDSQELAKLPTAVLLHRGLHFDYALPSARSAPLVLDLGGGDAPPALLPIAWRLIAGLLAAVVMLLVSTQRVIASAIDKIRTKDDKEIGAALQELGDLRLALQLQQAEFLSLKRISDEHSDTRVVRGGHEAAQLRRLYGAARGVIQHI
jgi:hypothetical protein